MVQSGYALDSGNHHRLGLRLPVTRFRNVRRQRASAHRAPPRRLGARKTVAVGLIGRRTPPTHTTGAVPGHCCEPRSAGNHQILGLPESSAYPLGSISVAFSPGRRCGQLPKFEFVQKQIKLKRNQLSLREPAYPRRVMPSATGVRGNFTMPHLKTHNLWCRRLNDRRPIQPLDFCAYWNAVEIAVRRLLVTYPRFNPLAVKPTGSTAGLKFTVP
jgi:hypothetical protein